jgi:hypothetical protein
MRLYFHRRQRFDGLNRVVTGLLTSICCLADLVQFVQTFGYLVNFHPHIHVLGAYSCTTGVAEDAITGEFGSQLLSWLHSSR